MHSLDIKISEMKKNLMEENIKAIQKEKYKIIKTKDKNNSYENIKLVKEYNYHVKLIKKIIKYIKSKANTKIILNVTTDLDKNIVYRVISIEINKLDIGIPIDIRILTGDKSEVYMDCTYYEKEDSGVLYINNFRSIVPRKGYGGLLLKELDNIVDNINNKLRLINKKEINIIKGNLIPEKNVIDEKTLKKIYKFYNFQIDYENRIQKQIVPIK
ncbi:MAG: hypothetical protein ACRC3Y_18335 [Romboutsia sp.]|uniref:hypothetical protein n=1 Tax=Romboutsia sp. TaxID=1965302 RepID=UPI003F407423